MSDGLKLLIIIIVSGTIMHYYDKITREEFGFEGFAALFFAVVFFGFVLWFLWILIY
ncbi:MAG: hypothetical protein QGG38_07970 [Nitrospinaceae bacterium]|jgi:hypothetical protein|nr:hypothetical protein [Nitrospinaceae bacterium]|tara:strand:+ start:2577 stop:2747 length:171 start_codon:yes stop_codon:yes gene_type:complete